MFHCLSIFMLVKCQLYDIYYLCTMYPPSSLYLKHFWLFILSDEPYTYLNNFLEKRVGFVLELQLNTYINL